LKRRGSTTTPTKRGPPPGTTTTGADDMITTAWELLDVAANVIERDGHIKGKMHTVHGYCAAGALEMVANLAGTFDALDRAFSVLAIAVAGAPAGARVRPSVIPAWNDAPGRTAAEVIAMLRAVAATEKARPARAPMRVTYSWTLAATAAPPLVKTVQPAAVTHTEAAEPELMT
jgi:hypothetical protein